MIVKRLGLDDNHDNETRISPTRTRLCVWVSVKLLTIW